MKDIKKLKNVDLEFIYEELYPQGMDEEEAKEMDNVDTHISKVVIRKEGKIIWCIEPMLYNKEFIQGDEVEEGDDFATLHPYKPDKKEIESLSKTQANPKDLSANNNFKSHSDSPKFSPDNIFIKHIEAHSEVQNAPTHQGKAICKICGKLAEDIIKEAKTS